MNDRFEVFGLCLNNN